MDSPPHHRFPPNGTLEAPLPPCGHDQWVARIEKSKREDAVKCLTYEGACDVEVEPDAFKKFCSDTGSKPTRHTLHEFISKQT